MVMCHSFDGPEFLLRHQVPLEKTAWYVNNGHCSRVRSTNAMMLSIRDTNARSLKIRVVERACEPQQIHLD
jgi:hypothetical protein